MQQAKFSRFLVVPAVVAESVVLGPRAKAAACSAVRRYDADLAFTLGLVRVNPPGPIQSFLSGVHSTDQGSRCRVRKATAIGGFEDQFVSIGAVRANLLQDVDGLLRQVDGTVAFGVFDFVMLGRNIPKAFLKIDFAPKWRDEQPSCDLLLGWQTSSSSGSCLLDGRAYR